MEYTIQIDFNLPHITVPLLKMQTNLNQLSNNKVINGLFLYKNIKNTTHKKITHNVEPAVIER